MVGALLTIVLVLLPDLHAVALPSEDDAPRSAARAAATAAAELEELGETLKAAVLSGAISEEDALGIYKTMAVRLDPKRTAGAGKDIPSAQADWVRLRAPGPQDVRMLFQPEFLLRDGRAIGDALALHPDQREIAHVLLGDYMEAYELAVTPLREAMGRYRRARQDRWLAAALDRVDQVEADAATDRVRAALRKLDIDVAEEAAGEVPDETGNETGDARADEPAWARRVVEVAATMEERLERLRARVEADLAAMAHGADSITATDLVRAAETLRRERSMLRAEWTASLAAVAITDGSEAAQARFDRAMAWVRIDHLLGYGRLGGESMDGRVGLAAAVLAMPVDAAVPDAIDAARALLDARVVEVAAAFDRRTEATLERELSGLRVRAARDGAPASSGEVILEDQARMARAERAFVAASRRELDASVAVRDALLALLEETVGVMESASAPALARVYRDAVLRRGFPSEMRRRWSEEALEAAGRLGRLGGLDAATIEALAAIEADTATALRAVRERAIAARVRRDPAMVREQIDAWLDAERRGSASFKAGFDLAYMLGFEHAAFDAVDEGTERQLRALLTPAQFGSLPARPRGGKRGWPGKQGKGAATSGTKGGGLP